MGLSCCIALLSCLQLVSGPCSVCRRGKTRPLSFPCYPLRGQSVSRNPPQIPPSQSAAAKVQIVPSCCRLPRCKKHSNRSTFHKRQSDVDASHVCQASCIYQMLFVCKWAYISSWEQSIVSGIDRQSCRALWLRHVVKMYFYKSDSWRISSFKLEAESEAAQ